MGYLCEFFDMLKICVNFLTVRNRLVTIKPCTRLNAPMNLPLGLTD